ncbi:hypothetical protein HMPREF9012_0805 [Bacteroidetes bacterium oral taxon 272 str. F0290]|uniref:hypothetical protein n=1 Tax=Phocaeicola abscessus TaxID=555313 RepID=UPI00038561E7|nr:hypothetical protein [Phocaeicola abscessus]EPT34367.1 hypothetical protein HMPREF9012_0805 [Bacteroidetes bacterium oral taxon 272 str. F0290]
MDKSKKLTGVILWLLLILGGVSYYALRQKRANTAMQQLYDVEKEEMENEYSSFATQYDELQVQINNDSIRQKLEEEKLKTQRLLEELRQVKTSDANEIMRLKKELKTVRAVLRSYIVQIDSLNKINEALTTENKQVKRQYHEATRQISTLAQEKKHLNEKVNLASQLDATAIVVTPKNKRGKTEPKVSRVKSIAISFTIVKNITAKTGERTVYIQLTKPDREVLTKDSGTFPYENKNLAYSIKKYIEYTGEEQTVTVYWNVEEYLPAGTYQVYIFTEGTLIGQQSFAMQ